jgi:calpain
VLNGKGYQGVIQVNLWRYGEWETVIIDDRLPQKRNNYVYARCSDPDEFWVALIEKAFAKLHGCYEAIEGGMPIESMVDMTGGLAERYELNDPKIHPTLYK